MNDMSLERFFFTIYMPKSHFFNIVIHPREYGSEGVGDTYADPVFSFSINRLNLAQT